MDFQKISEAKAIKDDARRKAEKLNAEAWDLRKHDPTEMLQKAQLAWEYAEQAADIETFGYCYRNIGIAHLLLADLQQALMYLNSAADIFKDSSNQKEYAHIERNIGIVYSRLADYDKALVYLLHSLEISRSIRDHEGIAGNL
ncbi:MAG TPA: tetratricopeptide repeat protein, partial [Patescibacteria group bacterium]|nr:tetratricopeptide repeat protein [Patescibacteria group bacterium]